MPSHADIGKIKVISWLVCEQEAKPLRFVDSEEASRSGMRVAGPGVQEFTKHTACQK